MQVIQVKTRVDAEGKVILQVPQYLANQELELVIVYQLVNFENVNDIHEVVDSFYGCLADDPILLDEQNPSKVV